MKSDIGTFSIVPHWIIEAGVTGNTLLVWCCLAKHASCEDVAWPSVSRMAESTGLSDETVRRSVRSLQEIGALLAFERTREDGSQTSNEYRLFFASPDARYGGGSKKPEGGPLQKTVPPELEPDMNQTSELSNEISEASETRARTAFADEDWREHSDKLVFQIGNAIDAVPKFRKATKKASTFAIERLAALIRQAGPPTDEALAWFLTEWSEFHADDTSGRYHFKDPIDSIRKNIDRIRPKWSQERNRMKSASVRKGGGAETPEEKLARLRREREAKGRA